MWSYHVMGVFLATKTGRKISRNRNTCAGRKRTKVGRGRYTQNLWLILKASRFTKRILQNELFNENVRGISFWLFDPLRGRSVTYDDFETALLFWIQILGRIHTFTYKYQEQSLEKMEKHMLRMQNNLQGPISVIWYQNTLISVSSGISLLVGQLPCMQ